ncbi:MAG: carbon-nitrogen hydrolase family protein [Anaerolineae bacterium]|nr:carbon-nitrogen hydrolase family protein [Anaerolineae bacterium]MDW8171901.1 carbon-nitrogen hydrolase family protein [Anaerolineae bacterium]
MREISVAVVQLNVQLGQPEENLVKIGEAIAEIASKQRVDLLVFPELATSGTELGVRFTDVAQRVPGPTINLIAQRANDYGIHILLGMATKERVESVLYNSAILIGPDGDLIQVYNKVHLRGEERMAFREGFKFAVAETDLGNIGIMLGYDLAYPEVARSLCMEGAELICVLANWEAIHLDEWRTYLRARAYENSVFVVGANRVGEDVTMTFGGESMIVGPRGELHAIVDDVDEQTGAPKAGYAIARIDLDEVRKNREEFQFIQTRQPTTYRTIVKKY